MTDVQISDAAARAINDRFDNLAAEFDNSRSVVSAVAERMISGAGEFSGAMATGAGSFDIAWRECFSLCSTSAALVAGNTFRFKVELDRLDRDHSQSITF
jgi:hypothetical protein